jgi:NAD(P)-dependent dehydrogenase (short-subunit alcohol dehydrogenase family)
MHIDLSGKRVIVTGASRGIGQAIARGFAREGARVAVCARHEAALVDAADELRALGAHDVIARVVDVKDTAQTRAFVAEVAKAWGGVDVLVNNAGQGVSGSVETVEPEALLDHANLTQVSHYRVSQAVIPHMKKQGWGRIIDINAMSGVYPTSGIGSSINRAACLALTTSLAQTLARDNILVNGLNMGWIDTGQWDRHHREMGPGVSREEFRGMVEGVVPLGRFGRPEEVVGAALFLASDLATYISGASIDVSGALGGQMTYLPVLMKEMSAKAQGGVTEKA